MSKHRKRNKAGRRAYLKRFSSETVKVTSGVDKYTKHEWARFSSAHDRLQSIAKLEQVPPTKITFKDLNHPRVVVQQELERLWQSDWRQGLDKFHHIRVLDGSKRKLYLYFYAAEFFFVEFTEKLMKRSVIYRSRDAAMQRFYQQRIVFIETAELPVLPHPPGAVQPRD
jgi:hypothetical protein